MISKELREKYSGIQITDDMKTRAKEESKKREPDILHHFTTKGYAQVETDQIGFFGEFSFRLLLGYDWKDGIRDNYKTIDSNDIKINDLSIDVKTESIPAKYFWQVLDRTIRDNDFYGRRLFHTGQKNNLAKYDVVVMGAVMKEKFFSDIDTWFPIGWIEADQIISYPSGTKGPLHWNSGTQISYTFPAYQITTADLKPVSELLITVNKENKNTDTMRNL